MNKPIRAYYVNPHNMGDLLNEMIIPKITSREIVQCLNPLKFDVMGIGSCGSSIWANRFDNPTFTERTKDIIKLAGGKFSHKPCAIWGTGFFRDYSDRNLKLIRSNVSFIAVRGALSQEIIEKQLGKSITPVLCDGGILASELITLPVEKLYSIGFIPHFKEHQIASDMGLIEMLSRKSDATVIDLRDNPLDVLKKMAECEYIVSSSLHGCIVADSFHIPNIRVRISDVPGTGFKFDDYYSGFGVKIPEHIIQKASDFPSKTQIVESYQIDFNLVEKKKKDMTDCLISFIKENNL
jgi:pyruvyltransferase